jgi:hypothetical protein
VDRTDQIDGHAVLFVAGDSGLQTDGGGIFVDTDELHLGLSSAGVGAEDLHHENPSKWDDLSSA